jgi:hypothetical protein
MKLIRAGLAALLLAAPAGAAAHDTRAGALTIDHPWARVVLADRPAAGYMTITNAGTEADRLISASSPLADRVGLHTHAMEGGVMRMRPTEAIEVPAKGEAALAPGGAHLMIFGLKQALRAGDVLPVTVVFEKAGPVELEFEIEAP